MKRLFALAAALAGIASLLIVATPVPSAAMPVATDDVTYQLYGRVFPDPHGCARGLPEHSPRAKGNVCAMQFLQWDQVIAGLAYLEAKFPALIDVINLREQFAGDPDFDADALQSAGLPRADLSRDKRDLYAVKLTDKTSPVPEADRRRFAYSMSIHGIERAGIEGGIRAIEDLVTWAACERDAAASDACAFENVSPSTPHRLLDAFTPPQGPTAGEVLREGIVYFVLSNPDGWHRGEVTEAGVAFQRYNGNGMDGNRDWPSIGYTDAQFTPGSEPETRGYGTYLVKERARSKQKRFAGAIDLHGMLSSHSFSFTLLGAGQRDYAKNAATVETAITTWKDAEARLTWSPLVAPDDECPGPVPEPYFGRTQGPMCTDQWGTVWDTINYQVTGSFGDWMDSPIGLDAVGIDNEMAFSHLAPNNVFDPEIEQLHVEGNKGLIYAQIASLLKPKPVTFRPKGKVAYIFDPARIRNAGGALAAPGASLPAQPAIMYQQPTGIQDYSFTVKGLGEGVYNGGITIQATYANAGGISPNAGGDLILDYCGAPEHAGDPEGCREVARYYNQSSTYLQAGARLDLNNPRPGPYRIRASEGRTLPTALEISFSKGAATPVPKQDPYDVSRMDFFTDLNKYIPDGSDLTPLDVRSVIADPASLRAFDTIVVAGAFMPGFTPRANAFAANAAAAPATVPLDGAARRTYAAAMRSFAARGGALVLTDAALAGLPLVAPSIAPAAVKNGFFFAGWMDFGDGEAATYGRHRLAAGVNKPGAAEGVAMLDGTRYNNRHQTYEPAPLGYFVSDAGSSNAACNADQCDSPIWMVDAEAWKAAGGTVAARTHIVPERRPREGRVGSSGIALGELPLGKGVIRIAGALFPDPYEDNYHPYGLASYALTYTGYQVFENLIGWDAPPLAPPAAPSVRGIRRTRPLPATGVPLHVPAVALLMLSASAAAALRIRRI